MSVLAVTAVVVTHHDPRRHPVAQKRAVDSFLAPGSITRGTPESSHTRKSRLKSLIGDKRAGIAFNKHFEIEGSVLFHHACKLGCEGIVSKRVGSPYRFGRSNDWIKVKNPAAPAVKREVEEDWSTMGKRAR
jgi:ATP dependent DNA ligase domain